MIKKINTEVIMKKTKEIETDTLITNKDGESTQRKELNYIFQILVLTYLIEGY
jgi:hypothetical protein